MTAEALAHPVNTSSAAITPPPTHIHLHRKRKVVVIQWRDGLESHLSCLALRKSCACSGCTNARQKGVISLLDADIGIDNLNVHGVSAMQFHFSDGHNRGLYPWSYLRELSEQVQ